jgi:hypothetical protein
MCADTRQVIKTRDVFFVIGGPELCLSVRKLAILSEDTTTSSLHIFPVHHMCQFYHSAMYAVDKWELMKSRNF